jgi:hypothetical protein
MVGEMMLKTFPSQPTAVFGSNCHSVQSTRMRVQTEEHGEVRVEGTNPWDIVLDLLHTRG